MVRLVLAVLVVALFVAMLHGGLGSLAGVLR